MILNKSPHNNHHRGTMSDSMTTLSNVTWIAASLLFAASIFGETYVAASITADVPNKTIASKRTGSVVIALTNDAGRLKPGENHFCVLFQSGSPTRASDVGEVSVDFRLLVGRIEEKPVTAHLSQNGVDRYCGDINLGPQYYRPASYYAFVRYVGATGKKKSTRLFLTVR